MKRSFIILTIFPHALRSTHPYIPLSPTTQSVNTTEYQSTKAAQKQEEPSWPANWQAYALSEEEEKSLSALIKRTTAIQPLRCKKKEKRICASCTLV